MPAKIRCILDWQRGKYSKNPCDLLVRTKKNYVVLLSKGRPWINASTNTPRPLLATRKYSENTSDLLVRTKKYYVVLLRRDHPWIKASKNTPQPWLATQQVLKINPSDLLVRTKEKMQTKNKKKNLLQKRKKPPLFVHRFKGFLNEASPRYLH